MEENLTFRRSDYSPLVLAYMGDAFFETLAREYLIGDGNCKIPELNKEAQKIVTAESQSKMTEKMIPMLSEEELSYYKAGRNAKSPHHSKSASISEYRRATGLECLYGFLWLSGQQERARTLFLSCVEEKLYGKTESERTGCSEIFAELH